MAKRVQSSSACNWLNESRQGWEIVSRPWIREDGATAQKLTWEYEVRWPRLDPPNLENSEPKQLCKMKRKSKPNEFNS